MNWWQRLLRGNRLERALDSELRYHFDRQVEDHVRAGMSEEDARRHVRDQFGGIDQLKEDCRDARGTRWVDETVQDLRFAVRMLSKDRWFAVAAVTALALGIAVSNTVFTVANALVIRGLPIQHADRVVYLGTQDATGRSGGVSYLDYVEWRAGSRTFAGVAAFNDTMMTVSEPDRAADRVFGTYVSVNAFDVLGEQPILGRDFVPTDDLAGAPAVAMLGHSTWESRYGADPSVVGRTIEINGAPATVVGVMPDGFRFPFNAELWQPLSQLPGLSGQGRDRRVLGAFGRLDDGVGLAEARAELNTIAARLARDHPESNKDIRPVVMTFNERYTGSISDPIYLALFCAVGFVLLIACANVANLLLARSATRTREISMRLSLGATRWRIVRQLFVESLLLALIAGLLALGLSALGVRSLSVTAEGLVKPYWIQFSMDWRVFVVLAAVCLVTALAFGLAPALHVSKADANEALKSGSRTITDTRSRRWTGVLLTGELALTLMLLAGAGLMLQSVLALYRADLVIDTRPLLTMRLALPMQKYLTPDERRSFVARLEERLSGLRAIPSATIASTIPFTPTGPPRQLAIGGRTVAGGTPPNVSVVTVGARYFETLRLQMLRGRAFTALDGTPGHENVIVNQRFAAMHFQGGDPLGYQIALTDASSREAIVRPATIIGVSASVRQNMGSETNPVVYLPYRAEPGPFLWLIVRTEAERGAAVSLLREEVRALDSELPLFGIMTIDQVLTQTLWPRRAFSAMFMIFAGISLVLAAVGLYAVTAYSVTQRTQELGIRMALGARAHQVWWLIVRQVFLQLGIGAVLGATGAIGIGKLLQAWLVQTSSSDPRTLIATTALLAFVCVAAAFWPARRATRIDPLVALRYE